jgi:hypothetical protein
MRHSVAGPPNACPALRHPAQRGSTDGTGIDRIGPLPVFASDSSEEIFRAT